MKFNSIDEILDFAIKKEEEAADFYLNLADKMEYEHMKEVFKQFTLEEIEHKRKLIEVKEGKKMLSAEEKVTDLKIGENLVEVELNANISNLNYQQALIIAMKAEKAAYRLYLQLAHTTDNMRLKNLFEGLANEEAKHKLRFEIEYDDYIFQEG